MVGPHAFSEAARSAALFAVQEAAYKILLGEPGFGCRLIKVYRTGHCLCGILPNKQIVVRQLGHTSLRSPPRNHRRTFLLPM